MGVVMMVVMGVVGVVVVDLDDVEAMRTTCLGYPNSICAAGRQRA